MRLSLFFKTLAITLLISTQDPIFAARSAQDSQSESAPLPVHSDQVLGYSSAMVTLNEQHFHYVSQGEGKTVILLHGYPFFGASWDNLLGPLSQQYQVIAPDNRGYGFSAKPTKVSEYHLSKLAEDVVAQIQHFSTSNRATLIGHDWGGVLAWSVAHAYPEYVEKVIVINAPPYNMLLDLLVDNPQQAKSTAYFEILKSAASEGAFEQQGPGMLWRYGFDRMLENGFIDEDFKSAFFHHWNQPGAITGALNWYRANLPHPDEITADTRWPKTNKKIIVPALLIWTEKESVFVPETLQQVSRYVDDVSIRVVAESNHTPFFDQPELTLQYIQQFLAQPPLKLSR